MYTISDQLLKNKEAIEKYQYLQEKNLFGFQETMTLYDLTQDRIAKRLGVPQQTISRYLSKMPQVAKWVNSDLLKGFTVSQIAKKHDWPEPLVWSQALVNADDFDRFKAFQSVYLNPFNYQRNDNNYYI